jgi:toxin ParE1/3/4
MASRRVTKSPESRKDLEAIWSYIAKDSPTAASSMLRRINHNIDSLRHAPYRGEAQPQFGENIRRIIVDNYLVFYRVEEKVQILRIYHAARKWEDLFRAELE